MGAYDTPALEKTTDDFLHCFGYFVESLGRAMDRLGIKQEPEELTVNAQADIRNVLETTLRVYQRILDLKILKGKTAQEVREIRDFLFKSQVPEDLGLTRTLYDKVGPVLNAWIASKEDSAEMLLGKKR